jgi:putative tricarboxylic transport membrane protein
VERKGHGRAITNHAVEVLVAATTCAIGVVMIVANYSIGAGWAKEGPEAGYFPLRIGAILCITSVLLLVRLIASRQHESGTFVSWQKFKQVLLVFVPTLIYVAAIQWLGIYVASAVFIAAFMRVMDRYHWLKTVAVSIGVSAVLFWLFEIQFLIPLPKGPLESWLGY